MKFKGTIIITDPAYLDSDNEYLKNSSDWMYKTYECKILSEIGFTSYISESTLYGDWLCFTYKGTLAEIKQTRETWDKFYFTFFAKYNDPNITSEEKAKLLEEYKQYEKQFKDENTLGEFCADAGMVCVCLLEDVLKFNPNFKEWAKTHSWCVTIIEDFDGDIEYEVDENNEAHIVGIGNINFYTLQSGL